ncbi:MAG TPA: DUF882 domain-containing protein [Candidatus Limnocylindrales bacterium]|nr:DUF882 domain-containing protein [Candidatus Limnocylindrales bacterium]
MFKVVVAFLFTLAFAPTVRSSSRISAIAAPETAYRLRLFETHTNEHIDIVYRRGNEYIPSAVEELDHFLRDHRTGTIHHYDPRVFDLLHDLTASLGRPSEEIDVICGYRTPWSNNLLRSRSSAVARHSLHMQAMAIDIRLPGVSTTRLRDAALALHRGGVGYYAREQFVHVDVGRVRRW